MENAEHIEVPGRMNEDPVSQNNTDHLAFVEKVENENLQNANTLSFLELVIYVNGGLPKFRDIKPPFCDDWMRVYDHTMLSYGLSLLGSADWDRIVVPTLWGCWYLFGCSLVFLGALSSESHTQSPERKTLSRGIQYTFSCSLLGAFLLMAFNMTCNRLSGAPVDQKFRWLERFLMQGKRLGSSNTSLVPVPPSNHTALGVWAPRLTPLVFGGWASYRVFRFAWGPRPLVDLSCILLYAVGITFMYTQVHRWVHQVPTPCSVDTLSPKTSLRARFRAWFQRSPFWDSDGLGRQP